MEIEMFTVFADAMFAATLARRGNEIPERLKNHPDRFVSEKRRRGQSDEFRFNPYRDLW
jgi:hypothetical protein